MRLSLSLEGFLMLVNAAFLLLGVFVGLIEPRLLRLLSIIIIVNVAVAGARQQNVHTFPAPSTEMLAGTFLWWMVLFGFGFVLAPNLSTRSRT